MGKMTGVFPKGSTEARAFFADADEAARYGRLNATDGTVHEVSVSYTLKNDQKDAIEASGTETIDTAPIVDGMAIRRAEIRHSLQEQELRAQVEKEIRGDVEEDVSQSLEDSRLAQELAEARADQAEAERDGNAQEAAKAIKRAEAAEAELEKLRGGTSTGG